MEGECPLTRTRISKNGRKRRNSLIPGSSREGRGLWNRSTILRAVSDPWEESIALFLAEDLGRGDATTQAVLSGQEKTRASLIARGAMTVCGLDVARAVFALLDEHIEWTTRLEEGENAGAGDRLADLAGPALPILGAERVALNLLQRMCGIATATRRYVEAVEGTGCRILDTRKTAPGLRVFDKRAVAAGGGKNHRFGLDDGILIKDNHLAMAGSVREAVARAKRAAPGLLKIEVEVENESQLREALASGADALLIDNRTPSELSTLVRAARALRPDVPLEASGGIHLENVRAYAETGVDFVSVGALTHSVAAADISLEMERR
jgi:nicotinate-nucleotide pyrophosphorylase (carboxylating)